MTTETPIEVFQGKNRQWESLVTNIDSGDPEPITDAEITFSVKLDKAQTTPDILLENTAAKGESSNEIIFTTDGSDGLYKIIMLPSHTSDLDAVQYYYSVEIILASEERIVINGRFSILSHAI